MLLKNTHCGYCKSLDEVWGETWKKRQYTNIAPPHKEYLCVTLSIRVRPGHVTACPCLSCHLLYLLSPDDLAELGGRCCDAKLAPKCLPCSLVSPTTQSNHIRSLFLCLGRVRDCSCVHPRSTFGVGGPQALNVRTHTPKKNYFTFIFYLSSVPADNTAGVRDKWKKERRNEDTKGDEEKGEDERVRA